ncbi:hypothetical protein RclHR1_04810012 [Rhizophagus clarus]|uniref:Sel1 repeat protein n=1 Tax=Rhizophagus clarus TaxID=94130 RepID=A0A2Z6RKU4_9GLOM|nr:hypothetical protein RclHR1_04810012 [Rhizophagus clarus]
MKINHLNGTNAGCVNGQYNLGHCYENGIGTDKDKEKAFEWYTKSVSAGNAIGQYNLGRCYENGTGIVKNIKKAFEIS